MPKVLSEARKAIVAVLGVAATAVANGLITGTAVKWVSVAIAVATALGVYAVPNKPPAAT
jgi:hypothetical protein